MRRAYILEHWALTLLIAPFISQGLQYLFQPNPHQVAGLLEVYPITLTFSILFSLPTFLIYILCFFFLSIHMTNIHTSKVILILISIIGIMITMAIMNGSMTLDIIAAYSITSLGVGFLLKLHSQSMETSK